MNRPATEPEEDAALGDPGRSAWYAGNGDSGATELGACGRSSKSDIRVAARGECEETCALLGMAITLSSELSDEMTLLLTRIQNDLVDLSADIGNPVGDTATGEKMRIDEGYVRRLEGACAHFGAELSEKPPTVILPGGTTVAATLHNAYAAVRRAERTTCTALENREQMNPVTTKYLNRLGSLLYILARTANLEQGDIVWHPGMTSQLGDAGLWEPIPEPEES